MSQCQPGSCMVLSTVTCFVITLDRERSWWQKQSSLDFLPHKAHLITSVTNSGFQLDLNVILQSLGHVLLRDSRPCKLTDFGNKKGWPGVWTQLSCSSHIMSSLPTIVNLHQLAKLSWTHTSCQHHVLTCMVDLPQTCIVQNRIPSSNQTWLENWPCLDHFPS